MSDNGTRPSERFLKVHVSLIHRLGLNRAVVLATIANRLPISKYGMSIEAIASDLGLSWRQTERYILGLEKAGYITIRREAGKVSSITPLSEVSGVFTKSVRGAQIQTPVISVILKERKNDLKNTAASPACAVSPLEDVPGRGRARGDGPLAMIGDLLRAARLPSSSPDEGAMPIAARQPAVTAAGVSRRYDDRLRGL